MAVITPAAFTVATFVFVLFQERHFEVAFTGETCAVIFLVVFLLRVILLFDTATELTGCFTTTVQLSRFPLLSAATAVILQEPAF